MALRCDGRSVGCERKTKAVLGLHYQQYKHNGTRILCSTSLCFLLKCAILRKVKCCDCELPHNIGTYVLLLLLLQLLELTIFYLSICIGETEYLWSIIISDVLSNQYPLSFHLPCFYDDCLAML